MIYKSQYDPEAYSLKTYRVADIPTGIVTVIKQILALGNSALRGGLAYVFLTNNSYVLKDMDIFALEKIGEKIIQVLSLSADDVYLNHNTFQQKVITGFWKNDGGNYKVDVLLGNKAPELVTIPETIFGRDIVCISESELLIDRLRKISEHTLRKHSIQKTMHHYDVALALMKKMAASNTVISPSLRDELQVWGQSALEFLQTTASINADCTEFQVLCDYLGKDMP
jgi:hypothetical protein